ncbi:hypothetical protein ACLQ3K_24545 [Tsukamurella sp. DT100]|uniref:hypothetical protein n=1 Tax=Tsukamurella sp. DT100 TaxID=3393415 RepID=UPI003CE7BDBF
MSGTKQPVEYWGIGQFAEHHGLTYETVHGYFKQGYLPHQDAEMGEPGTRGWRPGWLPVTVTDGWFRRQANATTGVVGERPTASAASRRSQVYWSLRQIGAELGRGRSTVNRWYDDGRLGFPDAVFGETREPAYLPATIRRLDLPVSTK